VIVFPIGICFRCQRFDWFGDGVSSRVHVGCGIFLYLFFDKRVNKYRKESKAKQITVGLLDTDGSGSSTWSILRFFVSLTSDIFFSLRVCV
jgi:hypothetical protein